MAMTSDEYGYFHTQLKTLAKRLDALEANSRNAASSDQPIVGPPSLSEDSRALARPVSIPELEAFIDDVKGLPHKRGFSVDYRIGWRACCNEILQHLMQLDQGPVAKEPPSREWQDPRINFSESQQSEA